MQIQQQQRHTEKDYWKSVKPKYHQTKLSSDVKEEGIIIISLMMLFEDLPWQTGTPSSTVHDASPQGFGSHGLKTPRKSGFKHTNDSLLKILWRNIYQSSKFYLVVSRTEDVVGCGWTVFSFWNNANYNLSWGTKITKVGLVQTLSTSVDCGNQKIIVVVKWQEKWPETLSGFIYFKNSFNTLQDTFNINCFPSLCSYRGELLCHRFQIFQTRSHYRGIWPVM